MAKYTAVDFHMDEHGARRRLVLCRKEIIIFTLSMGTSAEATEGFSVVRMLTNKIPINVTKIIFKMNYIWNNTEMISITTNLTLLSVLILSSPC